MVFNLKIKYLHREMSNNYVISPKLYNTGFIPDSETKIRLKQGLSSQTIANNCIYPGALCNQQNLYLDNFRSS
jgi:hypothetical protein